MVAVKTRNSFDAILVVLFLCYGIFHAHVAAAADYYAGKRITVFSYSGSASGYTLYARVLSRYMPKHLAGHPKMIVKSMPGAGGLKLSRYMFNIAPKNGIEIATISRGIAFEPALGNKKVDFDPRKFTWIGSMSRATTIFVAWHTAKVKTAKDLLSKELILAGTGATADSELVSKALNGVLGTKFKIVSGYRGLRGGSLAMERGEVESVYTTYNSVNTRHPTWLKDGTINILFQTRSTPHPALKHIPLVMSLAKTKEQKQALRLLFARDVLGRPFLAPPGLAAERAKTLRTAFDAAVNDPELRAEAKKRRMEIDLVPAKEVITLIANAYKTPEEVKRQVQKAMGR